MDFVLFYLWLEKIKKIIISNLLLKNLITNLAILVITFFFKSLQSQNSQVSHTCL
jgi:hypothetical protein